MHASHSNPFAADMGHRRKPSGRGCTNPVSSDRVTASASWPVPVGMASCFCTRSGGVLLAGLG